MKFYFLPKTLLGKWSVGLVAAFVLLIVLLVVWGYFKGAALDKALGIDRFQFVVDIVCVAIGIPGKTYMRYFQRFAQYSNWTVVTLSMIYSASLVIRAVVSIDAFVTGLIGIIKNKERSILVFLAIIIEVLALIIILGELLIPQ